MTGMLYLAAILWAVVILAGVLMLHRALAESSDRPSLRHRDEQGSGDVNAKRDGGRLPSRVIGNLHSGSNLTTERSNHG